ncbi:MAG: HAMP domain-containing histidine kinase [Sulfurimonas sp.]|nr:HAMP domain-containing histidine kinase [Sulfurimonas sp.]
MTLVISLNKIKRKKQLTLPILVNSVFSIIRFTLENNNIKVIEELKCKDSFMVYSNELKQVIINLVTNAQDVRDKIFHPYFSIKLKK